MAHLSIRPVLLGVLAAGLVLHCGSLPSAHAIAAETVRAETLSTDSLQQKPPTPIAEVRRDADGDKVPDQVGDTVVVAGRVVAAPGAVPVPKNGVGALQDETGGIHIVLPENQGRPDRRSLSRGDSARVWGVLRHETGLAQIEGLGYERVDTSRRVPTPVPLSVPSAAGERYEGRLARVEGTVTAGSANRGGTYFVLREAQGADAQLTVFVSDRHADRIPIGQFQEGDEVAVTGIVGQYDLSYQILPRGAEDLSRIGQTQAYLWWTLLGAGGLGLAAFAIIIFLRTAVRRRTRELKRSREELQEKESRLRSITEHVSDGIYRSTSERGIVYANQAFLDFFGYASLEELREIDPAELYADPARREELIEQEAREGKLEGVEVHYQRKDGTTFVGLLSTRRVEGDGGETTYFDGAITDITERKRQREALQERQAKVGALYSAADRLLRAASPDRVAEALIELVREVLGYRGVSVRFVREGRLEIASVSESTFDFMPEHPPFDIDGKSALAEVYRTGETLVIEDLEEAQVEDPHDYGDLRTAVVVPIGEHGTFAVGSPEPGVISEFDTHLVEVLGTYATAVLDRLDREERLREERDLLDRLLATSPAAIVLLDEQGEFVRANRTAEEVLGIEQGEVTERAFNDPEWNVTAVDGSRIPEEELPFAKVIRTGEPVYGYEHGIEWPDGSRRILSVSGAPLPGAGGEIQGALFHLRDVTERKEQKQALRQRKETIEALYESTRRLLRSESREEIAAEVHGVLRDVFEYPFGHTAFVEDDTIVPKKTTAGGNSHLPHPELQPVGGDTVAARALEAGEAVVVSDTDTLNNDIDYGDLRSAAGVPIGDRGVIIVGKAENGDFDRLSLRLLEVLGGYTALVLDRLRREKALRAAKEGAEAARVEAEKARTEAEEAARLKSVFLANMSHEIRTPLTSIIGFAEALGTEVGDLQRSDAGSLEQQARLIEQSGKRLLETLEGVLNLSKLEAGQMELQSKPVDLASEARRTAEELRPRAEDNNLDLTVRVQRSPVWAEADAGGVQVIARNLISNAIKYTEEEGRIWVRVSREPRTAVLEVEDTGIGMAPEVAEDLFEPFRQASEGMSREYEGSGVGLAVTRKAAEAMGGSVEVETEIGEGSRFVVRLPASSAPQREEEVE